MSLMSERCSRIEPLDETAMAAARARQATLTKPPGSLGRLEDLAIWLAGVTGQPIPAPLRQRAVLVLAADHGVTAQGVSAYPAEVTGQMVRNFAAGGAAVNALAGAVQARVVVADFGVASELQDVEGVQRYSVAQGTADMSLGPAMTRAQAEQAVEGGMALLESEAARGLDVICVGEMGIGNTTAAAALTAAVTGAAVGEVTGRGTGIDEQHRLHKASIIARALELNAPATTDGLSLLSAVGGFEIAGLAGVMLAAAARRIPIILDGYITTSAALVAALLAPGLPAYLVASHRSAEPGHRYALAHLGLQPLLDLSLRLGEGTGALLALPLLDAALAAHSQMATFASAAVSGEEIAAEQASTS